ncbi:MAG: serine/threonine-protein phosphatase [Lentisphaerae bacterium]|nr:serine/threonine-protein phosphatase [Lentisphaerota bacterium]
MSAVVMPQLKLAGETHKGCVRQHNEDNFFYVDLYPGYVLAAVADGVGGHAGGEVASYLCCHRMILDWKALFREHANPPDSLLARLLAESLQKANLDIFRANYEKKHVMPMCTTVAAAVFTPRMVIVAHVGDSRVYCLNNKKIRQLTIDHTVENELIEQGITDPAALPGSHVISKALGSQLEIKPEMHSYFRSAQDRYLICSDGLSSCWSDWEIADVLAFSPTPRAANDQFIRTTLRRGAMDNVTVVSIFPETANI